MLQAAGKTLEECQGECEVDTGRRLGADLIVSGEVLRFGSGLRINLKLHDVKSGQLCPARREARRRGRAGEGAPRGASPVVGPLGERSPAIHPPRAVHRFRACGSALTWMAGFRAWRFPCRPAPHQPTTGSCSTANPGFAAGLGADARLFLIGPLQLQARLGADYVSGTPDTHGLTDDHGPASRAGYLSALSISRRQVLRLRLAGVVIGESVRVGCAADVVGSEPCLELQWTDQEEARVSAEPAANPGCR